MMFLSYFHFLVKDLLHLKDYTFLLPFDEDLYSLNLLIELNFDIQL